MVARSSPQWQGADGEDAPWQRELAGAFRRLEPLLDALRLRREDLPPLDPEPAPFGLLVPRPFAALMEPGAPDDPLLRQVLPLAAERIPALGFSPDPVGDGHAVRAPGFLQKYQGRALLIARGACALHCRYCFRRHYPYRGMGPWRARMSAALALIRADTSLTEVILSGGDPLLLADADLEALLGELAAVAHLRRLRLHSRLPLVLPSRITAGLCRALAGWPRRIVLVIHANHARELAAAAQTGLCTLAAAGVTLLNQSVLLRGVNDSPSVLAALSERLCDCGVLPYYLHQLDPVAGAAHFAVPDATACRLVERLRERLPGYLVPRLVRETPGAPCKTPLA